MLKTDNIKIAITTMKRHAYCIIAHNDTYCLEKLISLIDDERNDIFLVFDKKSQLAKSFNPNVVHSSVTMPKKSQLIDIQWGGISLMKAELLALSLVVNSGNNYEYIHLLSGVDLPIKSQDYIHTFFDNLKPGTNCIDFSTGQHVKDAFNANCKYYHLFTDKTRCPNILLRKLYSLIRNGFIKIQKIIGRQRDWDGWTFGKGTNWVSITYDFANYLVEEKQVIHKRFRGTHCSDEMWKHTMLLSSTYKDTIASFDGISNSVRRIDWTRGRPYTWRKDDFTELVSCKELFARKFSSAIDKKIIDQIYDFVKSKVNI